MGACRAWRSVGGGGVRLGPESVLRTATAGAERTPRSRAGSSPALKRHPRPGKPAWLILPAAAAASLEHGAGPPWPRAPTRRAVAGGPRLFSSARVPLGALDSQGAGAPKQAPRSSSDPPDARPPEFPAAFPGRRPQPGAWALPLSPSALPQQPSRRGPSRLGGIEAPGERASQVGVPSGGRDPCPGRASNFHLSPGRQTHPAGQGRRRGASRVSESPLKNAPRSSPAPCLPRTRIRRQ